MSFIKAVLRQEKRWSCKETDVAEVGKARGNILLVSRGV